MAIGETQTIRVGFDDILSRMELLTDKELNREVWERFWKERPFTLREQLQDIAARADGMTDVQLGHAIRAAYDCERITWNTIEPLPEVFVIDCLGAKPANADEPTMAGHIHGIPNTRA